MVDRTFDENAGLSADTEVVQDQATEEITVIEAPGPDEAFSVEVDLGSNLQIEGLDTALATFFQDSDNPANLIIVMPNGGQIILENFLVMSQTDLPPALTLADGSVISAQQTLALIEDLDLGAISTAAGGPAGGGGAGGAGAGTAGGAGFEGAQYRDLDPLEHSQPIRDVFSDDGGDDGAPTEATVVVDPSGTVSIDTITFIDDGVETSGLVEARDLQDEGVDSTGSVSVDLNAAGGDGSVAISVTYSGIPEGYTVTINGVDQVSTGDPISAAPSDSIVLTAPDHTDADFTLTADVVFQNTATGAQTTVSVDHLVIVDAAADLADTTVQDQAYVEEGDGDSIYEIGFDSTVVDTDGSEEIQTIDLTVTGIREGDSLGDDINFLVDGDPVVSGQTVTVRATYLDEESGEVVDGTVEATVEIDQDDAILRFTFDSEGIRVQSVDLNAGDGEGDTGLQIIMPEHSDDDLNFDVSVRTIENASDQELTDENDFNVQTDSFSLSITADADAPDFFSVAASGAEDNWIDIDFVANVVDTDGSETVSGYILTGLPAGAQLQYFAEVEGEEVAFTIEISDGTSEFIDAANIGNVQVLPPEDSSDNFDIGVTARVVETGEGDTAGEGETVDFVSETPISVNVTPVADAPVIEVSDASGAEDEWISLDISAAVTDEDGSENVVRYKLTGLPEGAQLQYMDGETPVSVEINENGVAKINDENIGTLQLKAPANSSDNFEIGVEARVKDRGEDDTKEEKDADWFPAGENISVNVTPVADAPVIEVSDASGSEDSWIDLDISADVVDTDGSESVVRFKLTGLPDGAELQYMDGETPVSVEINENGVAKINDENIGTLQIKAPADSSDDFSIGVEARVKDRGEDDTKEEKDADWFPAGDDIAVTVTPVADEAAFTITNTASGTEDSFIALDIAAAVVDTDGSESITAYKLSGLPDGATIKYMDGETPVEVTVGESGEVEIDPANISSVEVKAPADSSGDLNIAVSAAVTDQGGDDAAADVEWFDGGNIAVTVTPVADAPAFTVTGTASGEEDSFIALNVAAAVVDTDGSEAVTNYKLSGLPEGAIIKYMDGETPVEVTVGESGEVEIDPANISSVEVKAPADSSGDLNITVSAQVTDQGGDDAAADAEWFDGGNIAVTVTPVADAPAFDGAATASGAEDEWISLDISASVTDTDGSESVSGYVLTGLPAGAALQYTVGEETFEVTITEGVSDPIDPAHIGSLQVKGPEGSSIDFSIGVKVEVTDQGGDDSASDVTLFDTETSIDVSVSPVVDTDVRDIKTTEGGNTVTNESRHFDGLLAGESADNGDWVSAVEVNGTEYGIRPEGSVEIDMGDVEGGNPIGTLTVHSDGTWSFVSDDQVDHVGRGQSGNIKDYFSYKVTDADGDEGAWSSAQKVQVNDTVIKAVDDSVNLDEAGDVSATGNVLDNDNPKGGVDTDASVVKFQYVDVNGFTQSASAGDPAVTTQFGEFSIGSDGVFNYDLNDADGDGSASASHDQILVSDFAGSKKDWSGVTGLEGLTAKNNGIRLTDGNDGDDANPSSVTMAFTAGAAEALRFEVVGLKAGKEGGTWEALNADGEVVSSGDLSNGFTTVLDASEAIASIRFTADADAGTANKSDFYIRSVETTQYEAVTDDSITDMIRYQITDSDGDKKWADLNVEIADGAIEALSQDPVTVVEGADAVSFTVEDGLLSDDTVGADGATLTSFKVGENTYDAGQTAVIANFGSLTVNADGSWTFDPLDAVQHEVGSDVSDVTFEYTISDADGDTSSANQVISVEDTAPTMTDNITVANEMDGGTSINMILFDTFTRSLELEYGADLVNLDATIINVDSDYDSPVLVGIFQPTAFAIISMPKDFNGSFDLVVTATDADGDAVEATHSFTYNPVNDTPFGLQLADQSSINENDAAAIEIGTLSAQDADLPGGDTLTYSVDDPRFEVIEIGGEAKLFLKANNPFDFETEPSVTLNLTVEDSAGASTTISTTVQINDVNEQPDAGADTIITNDVDGTVDVSISALLGNDSDVDGPVLSINDETSGVVQFTAGGNDIFVASEDNTKDVGFIDESNHETNKVGQPLAIERSDFGYGGDDVASFLLEASMLDLDTGAAYNDAVLIDLKAGETLTISDLTNPDMIVELQPIGDTAVGQNVLATAAELMADGFTAPEDASYQLVLHTTKDAGVYDVRVQLNIDTSETELADKFEMFAKEVYEKEQNYINKTDATDIGPNTGSFSSAANGNMGYINAFMMGAMYTGYLGPESTANNYNDAFFIDVAEGETLQLASMLPDTEVIVYQVSDGQIVADENGNPVPFASTDENGEMDGIDAAGRYAVRISDPDGGDFQVNFALTKPGFEDGYTVEDNHATNELSDSAVVNVIVDQDQHLEGGEGNEIFVGGEGDDIMTGGGGDDIFAYNSMDDGDDTITDFASGDVIDLDALFDALGVTDDADRAAMVKETQDGDDAVIGVDTDGDGQAEEGFSITLEDTYIDEVTFDETTSTIVSDES